MAIFQEIPKSLRSRVENYTANSDLSAYQYCAVVLVTEASGKAFIDLPTADGQKIEGILTNAPTLGQRAEIAVAGSDERWIASGTFNASIELMCEANTGRAKLATSGKYVGAQAKQASAGAGHQVAVRLENYKI